MAQGSESVPQGAIPGTEATGSQPADVAALQRAFLAGLGVPDLDFHGGLTGDMMATVGELMRETTQGTIELLRLRAEAKSSLHADMTMLGARAINPLKAAWDADVALEHLLAPQRSDIMKPVQAVVDAYDDLRLHDQGLASGIQAALAGLLARLGPAEFEQRLGPPSALERMLPGNRKARLWDLLIERYEDFSVEGKQDFWSVFEKEFRRAYTMGQQLAGEPPS